MATGQHRRSVPCVSARNGSYRWTSSSARQFYSEKDSGASTGIRSAIPGRRWWYFNTNAGHAGNRNKTLAVHFQVHGNSGGNAVLHAALVTTEDERQLLYGLAMQLDVNPRDQLEYCNQARAIADNLPPRISHF